MRKFKIKTILVIAFLGIVIMFSAFNSNTGIKDKINVQDVNCKISAVSGKIHIDNNWSATKTALLCTGNGIYSDPYVIEDLVIDSGGSGSCILIENSNVYFKIENCTLQNSGGNYAGIELRSVNKGLLINNNVSINWFGIRLDSSINNTISGNTANNNYDGISLVYSSYSNTISGNNANNNEYGIFLFRCDRNIISGNTANNNIKDGIYIDVSDENDIWGNNASYNYDDGLVLIWSSYNTISGNTANNNSGDGIYLYKSSYNTISGNNLIGNKECIVEDEDSQGNKFSDNGACTYGQADGGIPGYNIYFLIGILPILVIIMSKKLKKS